MSDSGRPVAAPAAAGGGAGRADHGHEGCRGPRVRRHGV